MRPRSLLPRLTLALIALLGAASACSDGRAGGKAAGAVESDTALMELAEELLPAVEESSGLTSRGPVRLARSSREQLEAYVLGQLRDQLSPARAEAVTAAYARFGLLDPDLDLPALLRDLYLEQVVGYYDPSADTLFVREDVSAGQLRAVLVHEMVHALQDQRMNLDSLLEARSGDNDASAAARAAIEGQATFAMMEWQLGRSTASSVDLTERPDLRGLLAEVDLAEAAGMPALSDAPRLIRRSLIFPYVEGARFIQQFWSHREGRPPPLGEDLPTSTRQILHPARFADRGPEEVSGVAFEAEPAAPWRSVHADDLGELETRLFLKEFLADSARARRSAEGGNGDRYRLLRGPPGEVLVWVTRWDSRDRAREFESAVREAFGRRYGEGRSPGAGGGGDGAGPPARPARRGGAGREDGREVIVRRVPEVDAPSVLVVDAPAGAAGEVPEELLRFRATTRARAAAAP